MPYVGKWNYSGRRTYFLFRHGLQLYEEVMEDGLMDCDDCTIALMYALAIQAAELRARVKKYEDAVAERLKEKEEAFKMQGCTLFL